MKREPAPFFACPECDVPLGDDGYCRICRFTPIPGVPRRQCGRCGKRFQARRYQQTCDECQKGFSKNAQKTYT